MSTSGAPAHLPFSVQRTAASSCPSPSAAAARSSATLGSSGASVASVSYWRRASAYQPWARSRSPRRRRATGSSGENSTISPKARRAAATPADFLASVGFLRGEAQEQLADRRSGRGRRRRGARAAARRTRGRPPRSSASSQRVEQRQRELEVVGPFARRRAQLACTSSVGDFASLDQLGEEPRVHRFRARARRAAPSSAAPSSPARRCRGRACRLRRRRRASRATATPGTATAAARRASARARAGRSTQLGASQSRERALVHVQPPDAGLPVTRARRSRQSAMRSPERQVGGGAAAAASCAAARPRRAR